MIARGYFVADKLAALVEQTPSKALHNPLAIELGACESVTGKQSWRYPTATDAAHLTQLAAWGYSLSDVEQIITGTTESDTSAEGSHGSKSADMNDDQH